MSVNKYIIAGLKVVIKARYELLRGRSEKYLCDFEGEPDISVILEDERLDRIISESNLSDEMAEYLYTGYYFYWKLLGLNGFMLHSSCIAYNQKAYIFTADSGVGKSTHTGLWQKYIPSATMINDDKPAVILRDGVFYAAGTPWSGKFDINADICLPLGGIVMLNRGKENKIEVAGSGEALPFFMKQTLVSKDVNDQTALFELLDKLLRTVPVYRLDCDMSEQAVITSFEALTKEKYIKRK